MPDLNFDETDSVLAKKLAEISPPADLRARLLAIEPPVESRSGWWTTGISALAATIIAALALLSLFHPDSGLDAATAHFAGFLSGDFRLAMETSSLPDIESWLAEKGEPMAVPAMMATRTPLGCREVTWRGHRGALVCFSMKQGGEAHLVMFPAGEMPGPQTPELASAGDWDRAAWTANGTTYLLFAPLGRMNELMKIAAVQRDTNIASSMPRSNPLAFTKSASDRARIASPDWT